MTSVTSITFALLLSPVSITSFAVDAFRTSQPWATKPISPTTVFLSSGIDQTPETDDKPHSSQTSTLKNSVLILSSATDRGQNASPDEKSKMSSFISELEGLNPTEEPTLYAQIEGTWELVYSSTQLFRSSPFFMAGRAVCETEQQAKQYDWFCDMHREALAISRIGKVRQIISSDRLISEFEVKAGAVPFLNKFTPFSYSGGLPITINGSIVSSANIIPIEYATAYEITMDTVEIKGSNIPILRSILDNGLKLKSQTLGDFLEENVDSYENPKPIFETTYLDDEMRISRDQDGKEFVYVKVSDDVSGTNYADVKADLGVGDLWERFQDVVL